jgi:hypothetical protein
MNANTAAADLTLEADAPPYMTLESSEAPEPGQDPPPPTPRRRAVGIALIVAAVLLLPWILHLTTVTPKYAVVHNWLALWIGIDLAQALALSSTGVLILRGRRTASPVAAVAAALLVMDAWLDVVSAPPGPALREALTLAVLVELPLAALLGRVAGRALSWPAPDRRPATGGSAAPVVVR